MPDSPLTRVMRALRVFALTPSQRRYHRAARQSGLFDPVYYRGAYPQIHGIYRHMPLRHFIAIGEAKGFRPNPDFSPEAYLRYNPDVAATGMPPFLHFVTVGHGESRVTKELPAVLPLPEIEVPQLRHDPTRKTARFAIVVHIYYPDLWDEFAETLRGVGIEHDLYVTVTYRGAESEALAERIRQDFPAAWVVPVPNRGRDILPFLTLVNSGVLDSYEAVCKFHTKKSPHRQDGDHWRRHLIEGILPAEGLAARLDAFVSDPAAAFWVADGQHYTGTHWWGSNFEVTKSVLRRIEIVAKVDELSFPAGSIYWVKPMIIGLLKSLKLTPELFETEQAQVDGTLAHAIERVLGFLAAAAGMSIVQTSQIDLLRRPERPARPAFTSAFYLPQFHPVPENDAWWGKGFTEWRSTLSAKSMFAGHLQPMIPTDLGFYDLRVTETMGEQAALARTAGIDAFCVYHYWFDGRRILEAPVDRLLTRPEIDFPFYLCWANESWRRNWDGLSGTVLLEQTYAKGFEDKLARDIAPYMRDPRYQRPDGTRPRFVIYRPEDMPDPNGSIGRLRQAFRDIGIGEVELGAVHFHISGENPVDPAVFDFWIEMPPHGLVDGPDYLFGGPDGNRMPCEVNGRFSGLVYDYRAVATKSVTPERLRKLPPNTIGGIMPSWDNTARRGYKAHVAYGGNPAHFNAWLVAFLEKRVPKSYQREMFVNAWNEWAEKAVLEPTETFGTLYLDVLRTHVGSRPAERPKRSKAVTATREAPEPAAAGRRRKRG